MIHKKDFDRFDIAKALLESSHEEIYICNSKGDIFATNGNPTTLLHLIYYHTNHLGKRKPVKNPILHLSRMKDVMIETSDGRILDFNIRKLDRSHSHESLWILSGRESSNPSSDASKPGKFWESFAKVEIPHPSGFQTDSEFVAKSSSMQQVLSLAEKAAETDSTVLILGESGCGKSRLARWIHKHSQHSTSILLRIKCQCLKDTDSETDSSAARLIYALESDFEGTVFLESVDELNCNQQKRLLSLLERRDTIHWERQNQTRWIASSRNDLWRLTKRGVFREDLYYRLNVVPISFPSLRTRKQDILDLARIFYREAGHSNVLNMEQGAEKRLLDYAYPGNARELKGLMTFLGSRDFSSEITLDMLPPQIQDNLYNF